LQNYGVNNFVQFFWTTLYIHVLKATIENKAIFVTTNSLKINNKNNFFIASVIAQSNCHISQFSHQNLLLNDALKPATPLTNGAINQTLRQFAPHGASAD